jgi:rare lipoprotein A
MSNVRGHDGYFTGGIGRILGAVRDGLRSLAPQRAHGATVTGMLPISESAVIRKAPAFSTVLKEEATRAAVADSTPGNRELQVRGKERWVEYTVRPGDTLWSLATKKFHVHMEQLASDNGIKDLGKISPGQKIRVRLPSYAGQQAVTASWYGLEHHGKLMANGEPFNMYGATIAHKDLPLGTRVELQNPGAAKKVLAVVTDRGPFVPGRDVDLSYGLAQRLALVDKGVGRIVMRVLG